MNFLASFPDNLTGLKLHTAAGKTDCFIIAVTRAKESEVSTATKETRPK